MCLELRNPGKPWNPKAIFASDSSVALTVKITESIQRHICEFNLRVPVKAANPIFYSA